jgi:hypothetical protein
VNAKPNVERLIAEWLAEEAPTRAPDRILTAATERIDAGPPPKGSRIGRSIKPPFGRRFVGLLGAAAVAVVVVGLALDGILPPSRSGPAGIGPSSPSSTPLTSQPPTSPAPSSSPSATAGLNSLCDLLSVAEVESASGTRWQLAARPGSYLDGDPYCQYLALEAAPSGSQGPLQVVAIEQLVAPPMVSYWETAASVDVPVVGATARWAKGQDTLVVTKGDMIVTIRFFTEQSQIPGRGSPPPAGGFEAGAMRIVQKVADRLSGSPAR